MAADDVPVLTWPAPAASITSTSLIVISIATPVGNDRQVARQWIRRALQEALGILLQQLPETIVLASASGHPLRMPAQAIGLSVSHASGLSVAAINLHGMVGIDLLRVAAPADFFSDWDRLARDYLGTDAATRIAQASVAERPRVFGAFWTAQEARLKCVGVALTEWQNAPHARLMHCDQQGLILPDGLVGTVCRSDWPD